jgi:hypothetical protein
VGLACRGLWRLAAAAVFARAADAPDRIRAYDRVANAAKELLLAEPDLSGRNASEFLAWLELATASLHGHAALAGEDEG